MESSFKSPLKRRQDEDQEIQEIFGEGDFEHDLFFEDYALNMNLKKLTSSFFVNPLIQTQEQT